MGSSRFRTDPNGAVGAGLRLDTARGTLQRQPPAWLRHHLLLLVSWDSAAAASATLISQLLAVGAGDAVLNVHGVHVPYIAAVFITVPTWLIMLATSGAYDLGPFGTPNAGTRKVISAGAHFLAVLAVAYYVVHLAQLGRDFVILIGPLAVVLTLSGRAAARWKLRLHRTHGGARRRTIVMGAEPNVGQILAQLGSHPQAGLEPVAVLVPNGDTGFRSNGSELPVAGRPEEAIRALAATDADLLLVAGNLAPGELRELTWTLEGSGVDVLVAPSVSPLGGVLDVRPVAGLPLLYVDAQRRP